MTALTKRQVGPKRHRNDTWCVIPGRYCTAMTDEAIFPPRDAQDKLATMRAVLRPLWSLPPPGPDNLLEDSAFAAFAKYCEAHYPAAKASLGLRFALSDALRTLGLPCSQRAEAEESSVTVDEAAARLVAALEARFITRRFLCPLDLADDLPEMTFGPVTLRKFSKDELADLFDDRTLRRLYRSHRLDARLSWVQWLVVEETEAVVPEIGRRALPFFYDMARDLGAINVHAGHYAPAVTQALFPLLLEPWEEWTSLVGVGGDWRGFLIPWVHLETGDLFVRPRTLPTAEALTFEEAYDARGEEYERPVTLYLSGQANESLAKLDQARWDKIQAAARSDLFSTPIQHFLVRGYFTDGMDQIMAHMTTIEASLGMLADRGKAPPGNARLSPGKRLEARIAALLQDPAAATIYEELFELRSRFVHGRAFADKVPSADRNKARSLARRVVAALVEAAAGPAAESSREDYLWSLA